MDNSKIIYASGNKIQDHKLLTTLCILYDEIIILNSNSLYVELEILRSKNEANCLTTEDNNFLYFYNSYLNDLASEHLIRFMSHAESSDVFEKADELELGGIDFDLDDAGLRLKVDNSSIAPVTKDILQYMASQQHVTKVSDFMRILNSFSIARSYNIPIVSDSFDVKHFYESKSSKYTIEKISQNLAILSIGELVFPEFYASDGQTILKAKQKLSDELIEFRSAILDLTYLVSQKMHNDRSLLDQSRECEILVNTKIKSALIALERRIAEFNKKKIFNLALLGGKIILNFSNFFTSGLSLSDAFSSGIGSIDAIDQLAKFESPTNSIASFLVKMKKNI